MSTPRLPDLRGWLLLAALAWPALQAMPACAAEASERDLLLKDERTMEARFEAELQACRAQFFVTDCVEKINQQKRFALRPIRERLIQIDEAERQRRAAERLESLAAKARISAERQAAAPLDEPASAPRARQRLLPPAAPLAATNAAAEADATVRASRAAEAAARASESRRRQAQVAERQKRVAERLKEREAAKKASAGLPTPDRAASSP